MTVSHIMEEEIEVVPSAENGNVPAEEIAPVAPSEPAKTESPTEKTETTEPVEPKMELYELPDGRKVDGATLTKEWKENFLPDYTRKSQELAKVKTETLPENKTAENPYADPSYTPQTYEEIIKAAEERAIRAIEAKEQAKIEYQQNLENTVLTQLTEVKNGYTDSQGRQVPPDPNLNENALFLHATKYGFRDLKLAHQNMKDMADAIKKTQTVTAANIAKRNDPVSVTPGATGQKLDPRQFPSAVEYLRALKGTGQTA